ncbi:uncharacterized protein LY89DRAFT_330403 [Mollisia scopiformis]|uniref:Uncharacterized protein n=1 Tax=Mollisia scopiformis TaxID=149040 RepID=A0A132B7Q5_MOLSC|nr:uncharacterized protein LY89DRAFT_330403 [Mollisia scopiformis]KUJ08438.1 hypothetical protein LY89DRAFT_330403 [Mollisia scopiformis]
MLDLCCPNKGMARPQNDHCCWSYWTNLRSTEKIPTWPISWLWPALIGPEQVISCSLIDSSSRNPGISSIVYRLSIVCLSSTIYRLSSIIYHLSSIIYHLSSIIYHLSSIIYHLSSIIYHLSSTKDDPSVKASQPLIDDTTTYQPTVAVWPSCLDSCPQINDQLPTNGSESQQSGTIVLCPACSSWPQCARSAPRSKPLQPESVSKGQQRGRISGTASRQTPSTTPRCEVTARQPAS